MPPHISIRPIQPADFAAWKPLWDAYNAFYGREGAAALADQITQTTWQRFFDKDEPVHAFVASLQTPEGEQLVGLVHYLFHRSTTRLHDVCYLQDLIVAPEHRGQRIAAALIEAVYAAAAQQASSRVYWTTQTTNTSGRALYDKLAKHAGFIVYSHEL
jgi:ribosomal protein S18 acetylase RimI-like enzyme